MHHSRRLRGLRGLVFIFCDDSLGSVFTMYVPIKRDWFRSTQRFLSRGQRRKYSVVNLLFPRTSRSNKCFISYPLISPQEMYKYTLMSLSMVLKSQPFTRAKMILAIYMCKESRIFFRYSLLRQCQIAR